jgi:DNA-binding Lrp family transcriptional regulator
MNEKRLAILQILEKNARATTQDISRMTGIEETVAATTIKECEENGIIVKYKTLINWDLIQQEEVRALVEIRVTPKRDLGFDSVAERIARFPEVRSLSLVSGNFDLSVVLAGQNMKDLANFVAQKLAALEDVSSTATHFLLKRYKEDGVVLEGEEDVHRLPIAP